MGQRNEYHLAIKPETAEGVDSVPTVDDIVTLVENPTVTPSVARTEGRQAPGTQARERSIAGRAEKTIAGAAWLGGHRDPKVAPTQTAEPPVKNILKAAGMKPIELPDRTYITLKNQTGVFVRGETVTYDSGVGVVENFAVPRIGGGTVLVLSTATSALMIDESIVGGTSGATATSAAASVLRNGWQYVPTSRQTIIVTATHANWTSAAPAVGDVLVRCNAAASAQVVGFGGISGVIVAVSGSGANPRVFEVDMIYSGEVGFAVGQRVSYISAATGLMYAGGGTAPTISVVAIGDGASYSAHVRTPLMLQRVLGARATFGIRGQAGEACQLNFELRGTDETHQAGTLFSNPTLLDLQFLPRLELAAVLINGWPLGGQTFEYSHNGALAPQVDYHGPNGIKAVRRTGRDPQFSLDPEMISPTSFDPFELLKTGANVTLVAQVGYQAANQFLAVVDYGEITTASFGERDGQIVSPITISCRRNPGAVDRDVYFLAL